MFKKIVTSLALTVGLVHTSIASEPFYVDNKMPCTSFSVMNDVLEEHGEIPFVTMTSYRNTNDSIKETITVMFVNPKTKTYTVVEKLSERIYCVVSIGENLKPYSGK